MISPGEMRATRVSSMCAVMPRNMEAAAAGLGVLSLLIALL
ncbi:hypothetical protein [Sphingopyxis terrae]|nr:hypothetical protein [Sphingopyxis terrae]MDX8358774.1 hypothetical protein [Sphingopyxis terrae]